MSKIPALIALAVGGLPLFQEAQQLTLTAEEIIERSIEATGGREAREKMSSTLAKGLIEFTAQHLHSVIEFYAKAPNKRLVVTRLEGAGEFKQGFDGKVAWAEDPVRGVRQLAGHELARVRREAAFNPEIRWREFYMKAEFVGEAEVGGRKAYAVRLTPFEGKPLTRYYDAETFLLVRQDLTQETSEGPMQVRVVMSDYRDVDGVKAPFRIEQELPYGKLVITISEIRNNVPLDDAIFAKPAGQKQTPKKTGGGSRQLPHK